MRLIVGSVVLAAASCSFEVSYDTDGSGIVPDAGTDGAASDAGCPSGDRVMPRAASHHVPEMGGEVCSPDSSLALDGTVAGLDKPQDSSTFDLIPGDTVAACLEVDFGRIETWTSIRMRVASSAQACSTACEGEGCDTNNYMRVYSTTEDSGAYSVIKDSMSLDGALTDYDFIPTEPARYIIVCRGGGGYATNDMVIDSVSAVCP